jgi:predicted amidophosphoribosyltransferase
MVIRGPHICPRCGERVTAFAAGCALCGTDLDPHRADHSTRFTNAWSSVSGWARRRRGRALVRR